MKELQRSYFNRKYERNIPKRECIRGALDNIKEERKHERLRRANEELEKLEELEKKLRQQSDERKNC